MNGFSINGNHSNSSAVGYFRKIRLLNYPLVTIALVLSLLACKQTVVDPVEKPKNLVVIMLDTVRADVFYEFNSQVLDPLQPWVGSVVRFNDAYAPAPWTVPSLASAFSGLWPQQHAAGAFPRVDTDVRTAVPSSISSNVPLLAEVLRDAGLETYALSAHYWTSPDSPTLGLQRGFDQVEHFPTDWREMTNRAEQIVSAHNSESNAGFFLYLHLMEAHNWHIESEEEIKARINAFSPELHNAVVNIAPEPACRQDDDICKRYKVYASAVLQMRAAVARMLEILEQNSLLDDTLIVVFSDHGEEFREHQQDTRIRFTSPMVPYIGHGHSLHKELLKIPLLVWSKQLLQQEVDIAVNLIDLGPSIANWLGVKFTPEDWEGEYLDNAITLENTQTRRAMYGSAIAFGAQQISVQYDNNKAILFLDTPDGGYYDYYDLNSDPDEQYPLSQIELVSYFDTLIGDYVELEPIGDSKEFAVFSKQQILKLQSIGYLQGVNSDDEPQTQVKPQER